MNLLDIINLKCKSQLIPFIFERIGSSRHLEATQKDDYEEFLYQQSLLTQGYVQVCHLVLEHSKSTSLKEQVFKYMTDMIANKAGLFFDNLSDSFTQARGLDLILTNLQNREIRTTVLNTVLTLIAHDDTVAVKLLKLKVVSNLIKHFTSDVEDP